MALARCVETNNPILPDRKTVVRQDQVEDIYAKLAEDDAFLIISGVKGCGKSTLLRQIEGLAQESGRTAVYIDKQVVWGKDPDGTADCLRQKLGFDQEWVSAEDAAVQLKERNIILLVDEYTALAYGEDVPEPMLPLVRLVKAAKSHSVPTALVIHDIPEAINNGLQTLELSQDCIVKPAPLVTGEIMRILKHGTSYPRGGEPASLLGIEVEDSAGVAVMELAGDQAILVNLLIKELYIRQARVEKPSEKVTGAMFQELLQDRDNLKFVCNSTQTRRVFGFAIDYFNDNPEKVDTFVSTFTLEDYFLNRNWFQAGKKVEDTEISKNALDDQDRQDWLRLGLVRDEEGQLVINGEILADAICGEWSFRR